MLNMHNFELLTQFSPFQYLTIKLIIPPSPQGHIINPPFFKQGLEFSKIQD